VKNAIKAVLRGKGMGGQHHPGQKGNYPSYKSLSVKGKNAGTDWKSISVNLGIPKSSSNGHGQDKNQA